MFVDEELLLRVASRELMDEARSLNLSVKATE
jgi:hypothetical protein